MTCKVQDLNVLSFTATGFTLWHYTTEDRAFGHDYDSRESYWQPAADMLKLGDMILATTGLVNDVIGAGHLLLVIGVSDAGVVMQPLTQAIDPRRWSELDGG